MCEGSTPTSCRVRMGLGGSGEKMNAVGTKIGDITETLVDDHAIRQLLDGEGAVVGTGPRINQRTSSVWRSAMANQALCTPANQATPFRTCGLFIELHGGLNLQGLGLDEGDRVTSVLVAMIGGIKLAAIGVEGKAMGVAAHGQYQSGDQMGCRPNLGFCGW